MKRSWLLLAALLLALAIGGYFPERSKPGRLENARPPPLPEAWAPAIHRLAADASAEPLQRDLDPIITVAAGEVTVKYLAEFELQGRVLLKKRYRFDTEAHWSPYDFVIAWGEAADPSVYGRLRMGQRNRWWYYRYRTDFPEARRIPQHTANMHLIPNDPEVRKMMDAVRAEDIIRLRGHLVELRRDDGWKWRSSLSRTDLGRGACELILVQAIEIR